MFKASERHIARSHRGIQVTMWVAAGSLVLLAWLHIALLVNDSRKREFDAATRDLDNLTRVSQEHADRTLRSADQVIRFVQQRYLELGDKLDLTALTVQGVIDAENFNQVGIIDAHGIYALANRPVTGKLDLSDREHFKVHIAADTGKLFVSQPVLGRATSKWSIQLTRRITRPNGDFAGVVVISMDPLYFTGFYSDLKLGAQGMAALYGIDGIARARRVGDKVDFGANATASRMFVRTAAGDNVGSYVDKSVVDGVERLLYFRKVPHYPLVVLAGQDIDEVFRNHRDTRNALIVQGAMVSALILALALALTRHVRQMRRDLEAVRVARQQLSERTDQLDTIFSLSPEGFVTFDRGGHVNYANPAFAQMTGIDAADIQGLDETAFTRRLASRCEADSQFPGFARLTLEECLKGHSGRVAIVIRGQTGRVLQLGLRNSASMALSRILYFRDITQQTELDQIKSEFLSTAAHELRTPMASILGFSEVLLKTQVDESTSGEFLGIIYEQSNNMARILDELLDLARMEARRGKDFKLARIDLGALIADVVRSYKYPPGRPTADVDLPASSLTVTADAGKLRQALLNVLSNAYKYSPDGGPVLVSANSVEHQGCLMACIKIADMGLGMTEEQVRHVCERFYRADKSGKLPGSGLGMSIVKEIVELHGGTLSIASVLGQGSTISLFVPLDRLTVPPAGLALSAATT